jgi:hypothetical protein
MAGGLRLNHRLRGPPPGVVASRNRLDSVCRRGGRPSRGRTACVRRPAGSAVHLSNDVFCGRSVLQQGFSPEAFRMEIIAFAGLFALMVGAGMLNKKLSEAPWFKR